MSELCGPADLAVVTRDLPRAGQAAPQPATVSRLAWRTRP